MSVKPIIILEDDDIVEDTEGQYSIASVDLTLDARRKVEEKREEIRLRRALLEYDFDAS